jgi:hypothetical protein
MERPTLGNVDEHQVLKTSVSLIADKLDKARRYIQETYLVNGRLDPDHQYAMRVLASRQRELARVVVVRTRPPGDPARRRAEAEMSLKARDMGEIFRWMFKNHAVGRLECPGCDVDYVTDPVLRLPVKSYLARVCVICGGGVQHCLMVDSSQEALEALGSFWAGVRVPPVEESPLGALQADVGGVLFACDSCHGYQFEPKKEG